MDKLNTAKDCLSKIHPLRFRVELLENIFSLLFVTNEDVTQDAETYSDSGECTADTTLQGRNASLGSPNSLNVSQANGDPTVEDASHFFSISDENVMLWSDKTSSTNASAGTPLASHPSSLSKDPLLSIVKPVTPTPTPTSEYKEMYGVAKTKSKDAPISTNNFPKRLSGNASVASTGSAAGWCKVGFLVNEYVVRDMLHVLKECLLELNATKFKLISGSEDGASEKSPMSTEERKKLESALNQSVASDVSEEKLQQRISRLQQCVSEATWRFQLAAHEWLPPEPGEIIVDLCKVDDLDDDFGKCRSLSFFGEQNVD